MSISRTPHAVGREPVCITGMGLCLPVAQGQQAAAKALMAGYDAITTVRSFDASMLTSGLVSEFNPAAREFGLQEVELDTLDRATWFALAALREAIAQSNLQPLPCDAERIGVVLGSSHAGIGHIERCYLARRDGLPVPPHWLKAAGTEHSAAIVAERLGARGPRATVSSACASSNTAVGVALDWLVNDKADCVIVVGTDTISPSILAGFNALRAVSVAPAAPFSTPAGITLGEGAGVLVMEREISARQRGASPLAWVRGYGLSGDAFHETATDPEGTGVETAMRAALADAGLEGPDIDYVSAHGTGTDSNDIPESHATARVVGTGTPLSSPKSFLGHTLGASGVIELIVTCIFAERGLVPPTRHFDGVRPGCPDLDYVPNEPRAHDVCHFLCNNYGFGGNNSSLVVSRKSGPCAHRGEDDDVLVLGQGAMGAFGAGPTALFDRLWSEEVLIGERGESGPALLGARLALANLKPMGNSRASLMIRCAIAAVDQAMSQAGGAATLVDSDPRRCALISGISHGALRHVQKLMSSIFDDGLQYASATHFPLTTMNAPAGQVSKAYGIKGYNTTFCGIGGALQYAHQIVRDGRQDRAITFGADEVTPLLARVLAGVPGLDAPGVAPLGEGAAALVLERASVARARGAQGLARLRAVACAQPDGLTQHADTLTRAASLALCEATVRPDEVVAVLSVGHGPAVLTQAEFDALLQIFGKQPPPLLSAARAAGLSASALLLLHVQLAIEILRRGELPPETSCRDSRPIARRGPLLVLHPALGGECHAVIVDLPVEAA